jgi:hypothetical protein
VGHHQWHHTNNANVFVAQPSMLDHSLYGCHWASDVVLEPCDCGRALLQSCGHSAFCMWACHLQAQQVAQRLAATIVTKLQQLRALNGVPRSAVSAPSPDQQQSSLTLDLSTRALGPIGAAALLRMAAAAQRLGPALQALNLNGCLLAPGGYARGST